MVQHKPTPEEQLLKLIENPDAKKQAGAKSSGSASKEEVAKKNFLPSLGKIRGFFSYWKEKLSSPKPAAEGAGLKLSINLKWLNHLLLAMVIASLIYLILDLFVLKPDRKEFLAQVSTSDAVYPLTPEGVQTSAHDLAYYQEPLGRRNPFMPPSYQPAEETPVVTQQPVQKSGKAIEEMLQGVKLVGISMGSEGPIAMIEESATGRTYFLKQGQFVNELKVQKIDREKVIVTYEGDEAELY